MGVIFNGCLNYAKNAYYPKPVPFTYGIDDMTVKFSRRYTNNGLVMRPSLLSDFQLVADDLTVSSDWISRIGSFSGPIVGTDSVEIETPFYPSGSFMGVGYRKSVGVFSGSSYYLFPDDPAHYINNTDYITYLISVKAPRPGSGDETILNVGGGVGSNLKIYFDNTTSPGTTYIRAIVDFNITSCNAAVEVDPDAFTLFMVRFDPFFNELSVYTPNGNAFSTGSGIIEVPAGTGLFVGNDAFGHTTPISSGRIIELLRIRDNVSSTTYNEYWWKWFGIVADTGQYPSSFQRSSPAMVEVNKKYWKMGKFVPRINQNGLLIETLSNNLILNNFIQDGIASVWGSFPSGSSTITDNSTDQFIDNGVTDQCVEFSFDVLGSTASIAQTTVVSMTANSTHMMNMSWRGTGSNCKIAYVILCYATGNWYDATNKVWDPVQTINYFTHADDQKYLDHLLFQSDSLNSVYLFGFGSPDDISQAGRTLFVYNTTFGVSESRSNPVYSPGASIGISGSEIPPSYQSASNIDYSNGKINIELIPENSSSEITSYDKCYFGSSFDLIKQIAGQFKFTVDLGSSLVETIDSYDEFEQINLQLSWNNPGFLILTNITKGSDSVDQMSVDVGSGGYFTVGGGYSTLNRSNGYMKSVVIR